MRYQIDDPSKIDSLCHATPIDAEGPTDEVCKGDATTFVDLTSGVRRYICADHAAEVDRFDDQTDDHPTVKTCDACQKLTPSDKVDFDGRCVECQI